MLIRHILEDAILKTPDRIAVKAGDEEFSYRLLAERVARLEAGFQQIGLSRGDRLAVLLPNTIELVTTILAASCAELVLVPLSLAYAPPQNGFIMSNTGARALVTSTALLPFIPADALERLSALILTDQEAPRGIPYGELMRATPKHGSNPGDECSPDPIALLVFTSGTTGYPKGIAHAQSRLLKRADDFAREMSLTAEDVAFVVFPVARPVSLVYHLFAMLRVGGAVALADRPDKDGFWELYGRMDPTYCIVMPSYARTILETPAATLADHSRFRFWICSGDRSSVELHREVERITGRPLLNMLGMTETGALTIHPPKGPFKDGAIGKPMHSVEMRLVDQDGREVGPGTIGRLLIRTPNMMVGYWNDTLETHRAIGTGWFDTQDLLKIDEDGYYWFMGRARDIIVRNAANVASALVMERLLKHPAVEEAALVGIPDSSAGQLPVAFYRSRAGAADPGAGALHEWVSPWVDTDSIPTHYFRIDQWPLTPLGKIDRDRLIRMAEARAVAPPGDAPDQHTPPPSRSVK